MLNFAALILYGYGKLLLILELIFKENNLDIHKLAEDANIKYLKWKSLYMAEIPVDAIERSKLRIELADAASAMHGAESRLDEAIRASREIKEPPHDNCTCSSEGL